MGTSIEVGLELIIPAMEFSSQGEAYVKQSLSQHANLLTFPFEAFKKGLIPEDNYLPDLQ